MADFNFDDLKKTITDAAEVVTKKTGDFVGVQKLKGQIYALGHSVDKKYQELGAVVFDEYSKGGEINDESAIVCEEISQINANIAELREELASKHGCTICPTCEAEVPFEAMFCMKCGAQMPEEKCECESADCPCDDDIVKAKEALKEVGKKVEKVSKEVVKDASEAVKDASKEVKKVSKATAKGAKTAAKGTKKAVTKGASTAAKGTSKAVKKAVDGVKKDLEK